MPSRPSRSAVLCEEPAITPVTLFGAAAMLVLSGLMLLSDGQGFAFAAFTGLGSP